MTTPTPLAALFGLALTAAVVALLVFGGSLLLEPVTWKVAGLSSVGTGFLWMREWHRKRKGHA